MISTRTLEQLKGISVCVFTLDLPQSQRKTARRPLNLFTSYQLAVVKHYDVLHDPAGPSQPRRNYKSLLFVVAAS